MEQEYINFLKETFLLDGIDPMDCYEILKELPYEVREYQRGNIIFSPADFKRKIGFVIDGECLISRHSSIGHNVTLNVVKKGASFGITSIFSKHDNFPTTVSAKTFCSIFFLDSQILMQIIESNHTVSLNVIRFLTERIEFLNERIAAFSEISVEKKLVNHILSLQKRCDSLDFNFNKKQTAEAISCGRASLYRAMDTLSERGLVRFDNKKIYITDLEGLERITK